MIFVNLLFEMVNETGTTHRALILEILRRSPGPLGGDEIGNRLGISRVAVHNHMHILTTQGYEISSSRSGYRIEENGIPPLTPSEFLPGERVTVHQRTGSTMNLAQDLARRETADFTVAAVRQDAGRGRRERHWESPEGGLWITRVIHPPGSATRFQLYVMAGVTTLVRLLRARGIAAKAKWPNDVHVNGRKVAGVLGEAVVSGDRFTHLAIGLGLNLNNIPVEGALSLKQISGHEQDRREWLRAWVAGFDRFTASPEFTAGGTPRWWNSLMLRPDHPVTLSVFGSRAGFAAGEGTSPAPVPNLPVSDPVSGANPGRPDGSRASLPGPAPGRTAGSSSSAHAAGSSPAAAVPGVRAASATPSPLRRITGVIRGVDGLGRLKVLTPGGSVLHFHPGDVEEIVENPSLRRRHP